MTNYKGLLISAGAVVTFLLAAFGGFLTRIAPPDQTGASFAVGIVSFLILAVLLAVSAIGRRLSNAKNNGKKWIVAGVASLILALPAAYLYSRMLSSYTYWYPPEQPMERHVKADVQDLTPVAAKWARENPGTASAGELELNFPYDQIWEREAIAAANRKLLLTYVWLVLSLAIAVFCLIEANSHAASHRVRRPDKRRKP